MFGRMRGFSACLDVAVRVLAVDGALAPQHSLKVLAVQLGGP